MGFRPVAIILQSVVVVTALIAAWFWYRSAAVEMPPIDFHLDEMTLERGRALTKAFADVARLNRIAAEWTSISALFVGVSSLLRWARP